VYLLIQSKFFYCRIDAKNPCIEDTFDSLQTPGDDMTKIKALSKIFDRMGFVWVLLVRLVSSNDSYFHIFNRIFTNLVAVLDQTFPLVCNEDVFREHHHIFNV
jgi:hypothetical protein